jgi:hypothetical protein
MAVPITKHRGCGGDAVFLNAAAADRSIAVTANVSSDFVKVR